MYSHSIFIHTAYHGKIFIAAFFNDRREWINSVIFDNKCCRYAGMIGKFSVAGGGHF